MTSLEGKLEQFYPTLTWQTHCIDVATLPLHHYQEKQLVIIAGIGGDLMIQLIEAIYNQHKNLPIDFLLCPVHHQFLLREKLIELNFGLKDEALVKDNKRFYEVIYVTSDKNNKCKINPVGGKIWQVNSASLTNQAERADQVNQVKIAQQYLHKTLSHYQRIQNSSNSVQHIVEAYNQVTPKLYLNYTQPPP